MTLEAISKYLATAEQTVDGYMENCFSARLADLGFHGDRDKFYQNEFSRRVRLNLPDPNPPWLSHVNERAAMVNLTELVTNELDRLSAYIGIVNATAARMASQLKASDAAGSASSAISRATTNMNAKVSAARQKLLG